MLKRGSSATEVNGDFATASDDASKTETDIDTEKTVTVEETPTSPGPCPYQEKEKVLAFHSSKIYEAKVMKVSVRWNNQWCFKIHYMRWNKDWDEWVGVDRLMKDTEANRHRQRVNNFKQDEENMSNPGHANAMLLMKRRCHGRGRKRKNSPRKENNGLEMENLVNVELLPRLKKQLVDDCEFITHLGKLVKLPRTPNVDDILEKFRVYMSMKDGSISDSTGEIMKGLRSYFDKALPIMLLYQSEREQYEDAVAADVSPSTVYGAEHLLRLFVKLPELMVQANIEEETLRLLQRNLVDFLKFLQENHSAFFLSKYHSAEDAETSTNKQEDD